MTTKHTMAETLRKVLFADDTIAVRRPFAQALRDAGFDVIAHAPQVAIPVETDDIRIDTLQQRCKGAASLAEEGDGNAVGVVEAFQYFRDIAQGKLLEVVPGEGVGP